MHPISYGVHPILRFYQNGVLLPEEAQLQYAEKAAAYFRKKTGRPITGEQILSWAKEGGAELILKRIGRQFGKP
jgi:hypothetical protein